MSRRVATGAARRWLLAGALAASAIALGTTKFPAAVPTRWAYTTFEAVMWTLHLLGGAIWLGGLVAMLLVLIPGAVPRAERSRFWATVIRRFSAIAMSCVAAIVLSGLFLYWEHVDGPTQLLSTMYGRVLGLKIVLVAVLIALGALNQFWLHPRIAALRATGDDRPLHTILFREFPTVIGVEVLLLMTVLFIAPFLHGSARNQAFQAAAAKGATGDAPLPRIPAKDVQAATWIWGTLATVAVIVIMIGAYRLSGRRAPTTPPYAGTEHPEPAVTTG